MQQPSVRVRLRSDRAPSGTVAARTRMKPECTSRSTCGWPSEPTRWRLNGRSLRRSNMLRTAFRLMRSEVPDAAPVLDRPVARRRLQPRFQRVLVPRRAWRCFKSRNLPRAGRGADWHVLHVERACGTGRSVEGSGQFLARPVRYGWASAARNRRPASDEPLPNAPGPRAGRRLDGRSRTWPIDEEPRCARVDLLSPSGADTDARAAVWILSAHDLQSPSESWCAYRPQVTAMPSGGR